MSTLEFIPPIYKTAGHLFEAACQLINAVWLSDCFEASYVMAREARTRLTGSNALSHQFRSFKRSHHKVSTLAFALNLLSSNAPHRQEMSTYSDANGPELGRRER
jgi:hypothetical protein